MVEQDTGTERLRRVELFAGLSDEDLAVISGQLKGFTFAEGAVVVEEGGAEARFHLIVEGTARVVADGRTTAQIGPGAHFGEVSLIDREAPSASVIAETPLRTLSLASFNFRPLVSEHPELAWKLLEQLCRLFRRQQSPLL